MKTQSKHCKSCGKEFFKRNTCSKKEWASQYFCSKSCAKINRPSWNKGKIVPIEVRLKISSSLKGNIPWNKDKIGLYKLGRQTDEHRMKLSLSQLGISRPQTSDEKNGIWKGDKASYGSIHDWVIRKLGQPNSCSQCGKIGSNYQIQWSNVDHKYKRNLEDWNRLCIRCHREHDRTLK